MDAEAVLKWATETCQTLYSAAGETFFNEEIHALVVHFEDRGTVATDSDVARDLDILAAALKIAMLRMPQ